MRANDEGSGPRLVIRAVAKLESVCVSTAGEVNIAHDWAAGRRRAQRGGNGLEISGYWRLFLDRPEPLDWRGICDSSRSTWVFLVRKKPIL
jgi:hypothetical protein